jgi:hypothetical protein
MLHVWERDLKEGDHFEYLCADRRIILQWIFKKRNWGKEWIKSGSG